MPRPPFYLAMGLVAIVVAVLGFLPGLVRPVRLGSPTPLVMAHGAIAAAWLALYVAQTTFIAGGAAQWHRRLGVLGAVLALAFVTTGYTVAIACARRGYDLSGDLHVADDPLGQLVFPLGDLVSFTVLVALALIWRRRPDRHKRLMLLATVGALMPAPLAHVIGQVPALYAIPAVILVPIVGFLFASAVRDRLVDGRIHPVSLWAALAMLVWAQGRAALIGPSEVWHRAAAWLVA